MISTVTPADPSEAPFLFVGNHPALDFLNTAPIENGAPAERLLDYDALVAWLERAALVSSDDARKARSRWSGTVEGKAALAHAISLRSALGDVAGRTLKNGAPSAASMTRLNAELRTEAGAFLEVTHGKDGFASALRVRSESASDPLAPLLRAVATLLTSVDFARVRQCEDEACVLFFHDTTKNHARRWCSMETCGNRNKVSAYRARSGRTA